MSSSPYYGGPAKKSNVGLIIAIVAAAIGVCCILPMAVIGGYAYKFVQKAQGFVGCGMTLSAMRDAMVAYSKAHGGNLPPKDNWQDAIRPYLKPIPETGNLKLPPLDGDFCDMDAKSSFAYNADVAGKKLDSVKDTGETIILWEVPTPGRNQVQTFKAPPAGSGPDLVGNVKRGWFLQPIYGSPYYDGPNGQRVPISTMERGNGVKVNVGTTG